MKTKINHRCTEYRITNDISIWEIETAECWDYYVELKGYPMTLSFGSSKDQPFGNDPRFSYESLVNMYWGGAFDLDIADITN